LVSQVGAFTLSLDCEGFWGLADQPGVISGGQIHDRALADAYGFLDRVLDRHGVRATAAFVSCFAAPTEAVHAQLPLLEQMAVQLPDWFSAILPAVREGRRDGWNGRAHFQRLAGQGHEMAWHGATHLCLADQTPEAVVKLELQLLQAVRVEPHVDIAFEAVMREVGSLVASGDMVVRTMSELGQQAGIDHGELA
jgi:hypothetical protein